jgi:signal transduction histidine kinase
MSLRTKYLLVLNSVILSMWTVYAAWSLHKTEEQFIKAEINSIKHLGIGLKLLAEHHFETHGTMDGLQDEIESLLPEQSGLDIMIIDDSFIVRLATQKDRIGKRWLEEDIRKVFLNNLDVIVMDNEHHYHGKRRAIDITAGIRDISGKTVFVVHVARWLDHLSGALNTQLISHGLFAFAILLAVGTVVSLLTYVIVLRPLHAMNTELRESGWLSRHPELKSGNEIQKVQVALHDAISCIALHTNDLQNQLKRSERLAVIGQMSAVLAHEIRNPLHIVRGTAETMLRRHPENLEFTTDIKEEVDRVERLIEELLHYTRQASPKIEKFEAKILLENVRNRIQKSVAVSETCGQPPNIKIESEKVIVSADPVMLEQALTNLVMNALDASSSGELIMITASSLVQGEVVFEVSDSGTGIAKEDLEKAIEPFFTRKSRGTGLGLAVVEKIADLHNGSFSLSRRKNGGTRAVLRVPKGSKAVTT